MLSVQENFLNYYLFQTFKVLYLEGRTPARLPTSGGDTPSNISKQSSSVPTSPANVQPILPSQIRLQNQVFFEDATFLLTYLVLHKV